MSSEASNELQRLLRLLTETATKAESEAYAAGWRDCRAAMMRALGDIGDEPQASTSTSTSTSNGIYATPSPHNGAGETSYAN